MLRHPRLLVLVLRFMALSMAIALPAVLAPWLAIEKLSWWAGLGLPPRVPLLAYMTAGGSAVYLGQAVLLWFMSCDVERYRPLIVVTGCGYLVCAPVFWWIHTQAGMPHWWRVLDSMGCLLGGTLLLAVARRHLDKS